MASNDFIVRTVTDTIGSAGSLTITADTTDDQVRDWLENAYGTPQQIRLDLDDEDEAEAMLSMIDLAVDTLTAERLELLDRSDYDFETYLGLDVEIAKNDG